MRCGAFHRVEGTLCLVRHGQAALSGSKTKAPGFAGGYLLLNATIAPGGVATRCPCCVAPKSRSPLPLWVSSDRPAPDALGMSASLRSRPHLRTAANRPFVPKGRRRPSSNQRPLCDALLCFHNPWQSDREGRPAAWLALDRDVAAHHLAEAFTDRESKARATVFARRGGGSLGKLLEQLAHLLRRHADAGVGHRDRDPVAAVLLSLVSGDGDSAFLGELVGVARQVEQGLPEAGLVGVDRAEARWAINDEAVVVLRRHRLNRPGHVLDSGHQRERFEVKLHAPRLDLGQIENVVDQGEQVPAGSEHAVKRLGILLQRLRILPQHLADADDGVEWRAQLVAHVGEELRFVLACFSELAALVLNFVEQADVLNCNHRLVGKGSWKAW